jgi:atypical dual specificity phosphatase
LRVADRGTWVEDRAVLGCAYPRTERALSGLAERGVRVLVNLHERAQDPRRLERHGLREIHLPVRDFVAPSPEQIRRGVDAILEARVAGEIVAVHCGGGLGRTGTLLACYLVRSKGMVAEEAIHRVCAFRPGSVETRTQREAVAAYARRRPSSGEELAPGLS